MTAISRDDQEALSEKHATPPREEEISLNSKAKAKNNGSGATGDLQQNDQTQVEWQGPGWNRQTPRGQNHGLKEATPENSAPEENGRATAMRHAE